MKRGLCAGNFLLSTDLSCGKCTIFQFSVFHFPFSVLHEFRRFGAVVRHHLQEVDAAVEGGDVKVVSLGRIIIRPYRCPYHHRMA